MILQAFRDHLAEELGEFPIEPDRRAFERYAVTSAVLARKLLDHLAIRDLGIPNGLKDYLPEYGLRILASRG